MNENQTPRTDICEECERDIVCEVVAVEGHHELIHKARTAEEGFMSVTAGKVVVEFSCRCGSAKVEYGPGSASAWEFPDSWMWPDEFEPEEVPRLAD